MVNKFSVFNCCIQLLCELHPIIDMYPAGTSVIKKLKHFKREIPIARNVCSDSQITGNDCKKLKFHSQTH
jgi:hypothetical protein